MHPKSSPNFTSTLSFMYPSSHVFHSPSTPATIDADHSSPFGLEPFDSLAPLVRSGRVGVRRQERGAMLIDWRVAIV